MIPNLTIIIIVIIFGTMLMIYSPITNAYGKDIIIVNKLDVQLKFKEIKEKKGIEIDKKPPGTIDKKSRGFFTIERGDDLKPRHLNVQYYVDNSKSGKQVGIVYELSRLGDERCKKDHPAGISEEVLNCGNFGKSNWEYIFSHR